MYIATHAQAISHHLSADAQLTALQYKRVRQALQLPSNSFYSMSYAMEYPSGRFKWAILILLLPKSLGPLLHMGLSLYNTAWQQL